MYPDLERQRAGFREFAAPGWLARCYIIKYQINGNSRGEQMRRRAASRQDDVLTLLHASEKPMTAYQILEELQVDEPGIAPPTVYRTLSALTEQGRAHRLESVKAFVPCRCDHDESLPVLAICEDCGSVEEHDGSGLLPKLNALTTASTFLADRHIVEIHGRCRTCAARTPFPNSPRRLP